MPVDTPKTMIVTGAAGGFGSALSLVAALGGWQVVMVDKNRRGLERHYDAIVSAGGAEPYLQVMDLASAGPGDFQQLADSLEERLGRLDALIHGAVAFAGLQPLDLIEPDLWLSQMHVNLNAPWLMSIRLLRLLRMSPSATVVFLIDQQAKSKPLWGTYAVSKAAVEALAAEFRAELHSTAICVHGIPFGKSITYAVC
jgi:NAD(P)-dependent dehydrogenase (short-subunit alcohol dehydrogenase family)